MGAGLVIGKQILIMFIILALGVVCNLKGVITRDGTKSLSVVELNIVNPVLIFMSYQTDYEPALLKGLMWSFALSAISFAAAIPLARLMVPQKSQYSVIQRFSIIYSNCGFMGIPLIMNIYGKSGVLYLTAYITLFNLLVWTHGYIMMKGQKDFAFLLLRKWNWMM
jgi:predicted permease